MNTKPNVMMGLLRIWATNEWQYVSYEGSTFVFLLNVRVKNDYMSIMKDLLFYCIECNCDECVTKDLSFIIVNVMMMNDCMRVMKDLSLYRIDG